MADGGPKREPCCRTLDDEEIRGQPDLYDCTACYPARLELLWPENLRAWSCYQTLCGRTVRTLQLHEWVLSQESAELTPAERDTLVGRLDLILDVLQPEPTHDGSD